MAEDYNATGTLRIPGLGYDGVQWEDMVEKLCKLEKKKFERLSKWKADWKTRYDAFDEIRSELVTLQSTLQKLNSTNKFLSKTATSSKPEVASVTLGDKAVAGDYTIEVKNPATKGITSVETSITDKFSSITGTTGSSQLKYTFKGNDYSIDIPAGTSLEGLKNIINNNPTAKQQISASLINGGNGYILQISTKDTGANSKLSIDQNSLSGLTGFSEKPRWTDPITEYTSKMNTVITDSTAVIWQDKKYIDNEANKDDNSKYDPNYGKPKPAHFTWQENGETFSVKIEDGSTYNDLIKAINNAKDSTSASTSGSAKSTTEAQLINTGSGYTIKLSSQNNISNIGMDYNDTSGNPMNNSAPARVGDFTASQGASVTYAQTSQGKTVATGLDQTFSWTDTAGDHSINVPNGTTVEELVSLINKTPNSTANAVLEGNATSGYKLRIEGKVNTNGTNLSGLSNTTSGIWNAQNGENAQYKINGWPTGSNYYESTSNTLSEVEPGITFNLKQAGTTTISVELDTAKVTENVQSFIDSVNTVRSKFKELTKFDKNKELMDLKNADSQFEMEKGSALTGNYGIQMIESRLKEMVSSMGLGFVVSNSTSSPNGDIFSSLAEIGITTNSDESSDNYGLLELRTSSSDSSTKWSAANFSDALAKDPEAVARLFSATNDDGTTRMVPDFSFEGRSEKTKLGTYSVKYDLDSNGLLSSININGQDYDPTLLDSNNVFTVPNITDSLGEITNNEAGLKLHFDNIPFKNAEGNVTSGSFSGSVVVAGVENKKTSKDTNGEKSYTMSNTVLTFSGAAPQTKSGTYDIRYTIDTNPPDPSKYTGGATNDQYLRDLIVYQSNGNFSITGTINGKKAAYAGGIFKMDNAETDDAKGIEVVLSDFAAGDHVAQVSLREGKVNQLINALKGKNTKNDPGILDSEYGSLAILKNNYREIMNGAQSKMEKEQTRLEAFKANLIMKFARLEEKLSKYNERNNTIKSQIQQLSSNSSK